VVAEGGGDDVADLAQFERESRGLELRSERFVSAEGIFAFGLLQTAIFGEVQNQLGEVLPLQGPLANLLDLLALGLLLLFRQRLFRVPIPSGQENVADADFLRLFQAQEIGLPHLVDTFL